MALDEILQKLGIFVGVWSSACFFVRMGSRFVVERVLQLVGGVIIVGLLGALLLFHLKMGPSAQPAVFSQKGALLFLSLFLFVGLWSAFWALRLSWIAVPLGLTVSGLLVFASKLSTHEISREGGLVYFGAWGWGAQISAVFFWSAIVAFAVSGVYGWIQLVRERVPQEWYRRGVGLFNLVLLLFAAIDHALAGESAILWTRWTPIAALGAGTLGLGLAGLSRFFRGPKLRAILRVEALLIIGMLAAYGVWIAFHVNAAPAPEAYIRIFSVWVISIGVMMLSRMQYRFSSELPAREVIEVESFRWFQRGRLFLVFAISCFVGWAWLTGGLLWNMNAWGVGPLLLSLYAASYSCFRLSHPFSDYRLGVFVSLGLIIVWLSGGQFWTLSTSIP